MRLVESPEDVDRLSLPPGAKVAYLTQTTLSVDDAKRIIARLRERFPQIVAPAKEDICYATQNRQEAVRWLAAEFDLVLVLGQPEQLQQSAVEGIGPGVRGAGAPRSTAHGTLI